MLKIQQTLRNGTGGWRRVLWRRRRVHIGDHRTGLPPSCATVTKWILSSYFRWQPYSSHGARFLHWLTSKTWSMEHPSTTDSTPVPVTRTQPRTDNMRRLSRCNPIERKEGSETAEPQKERFRCVSCGQPRAMTSVAVSERAQQNDYWRHVSNHDWQAHYVCFMNLPDQVSGGPSQRLLDTQLHCR